MAKRNGVLVIGQSGAGKTCLLSAMKLDADLSLNSDEGHLCRLHPTNDEMLELDRKARNTIRNGSFPIDSTTEVKEYHFNFQATPKDRWLPRIIRTEPAWTPFRVLDGPGGDFIPGKTAANQTAQVDEASVREYRKRLRAEARSVDGMILCVDSTDEDAAENFFIELSALFSELCLDEGNRVIELPVRRIAIVLTKAEKYFLLERYGNQSEKAARDTDPWPRATELLTEAGLAAILSHTSRETEIACGWVSAYGFIPGEGCPNYDLNEGCLLSITMKASQHYRKWKPFRLMDPLIYLTTGNRQSLQVYRRR